MTQFTAGQLVECVRANTVGLTKGRIYTLCSVCDRWLLVVNDDEIIKAYARNRFVGYG